MQIQILFLGPEGKYSSDLKLGQSGMFFIWLKYIWWEEGFLFLSPDGRKPTVGVAQDSGSASHHWWHGTTEGITNCMELDYLYQKMMQS